MNVKHGFSSTLNRFLGKKSKGHQLSKSTTNLSLSSHIDTIPLSSHLEQNRITPLPAATSNAPFEQTFRITVLLPKGQLYVARLGAKTKLEKLLELVCENKQLDTEKYEFRHPIDTSQVFSFELTIGAVGLSEIRLCHKSEAYDNFNADEIIKLRHTGRDSLSSSEFSSRNSKHTLKTASPYSSTNSLNSIDSTGMSTSYRGPILSLPPQSALNRTTSGSHHPPVAPARKKRVAPRPPSQNSIPERQIITTNGCKTLHAEFIEPKKDFHVSSPNLSQCTELTALRTTDFHQSNISIDCNGNNSRNNNNKVNGLDRPNGHIHCNGEEANSVEKGIQKTRPASLYVMGTDINYNNYTSENDFSSHRSSNGSIPSYTATGSTETVKMPEPVPRKRITTAKKKAPAPPPRTFQPPIAPPRTTPTSSPEKQATDETKEVVAEQTQNGGTSNLSLNGVHEEENYKPQSIPEINPKAKEPEKSRKIEETRAEQITDKTIDINSRITSLSSQTPDAPYPNTNEKSELNPSPTATVNSRPAEKPILESKPTPESSSDEEEQIKVYNLKLGKTIVKQLTEHKTMENLTEISTISNETNGSQRVEATESISSRSVSPGWTYTIPAPANFADMPLSSAATYTETIVSDKESEDQTSNSITIVGKETVDVTSVSDSPITPIIKERPPVDFEVFTDTTIALVNDAESSEASETIITSDIEDGYRVGMDKTESKSVLKDEGQKQRLISENTERIIERENEEIIEDLSCIRNISPLNSLESYSSSKSDIMNELNNVINEDKIDTVIRKIEDADEIGSVKPCALSNFKIQTYSQPSGPVKTLIENQAEQPEYKINGELSKKELEAMSPSKGVEKQPASGFTKQSSEDEKLYKKRSSLTLSNNTASQLFKSRGSITRSDSFHSTHYPKSLELEESLTSRSSSFMSLINAQKIDQRTTNISGNFLDTNRRKSSSELSIGESPSLQSLIVMKSILNSRKNSLNNENDLQKPKNMNKSVYMGQNERTSNSPELETFYDCDSSKENSPKNKILSQQVTSLERLEKRDDREKKWKYQGPPSINLSTWSERPKIQVSIKDDSDYKFGGGGGNALNSSVGTVTHGYRNSLPNHNSTIVDISCSNRITSPMRVNNDKPKVPFVRSVEFKKSTPLEHSENGINKYSNETNPPLLPRPLSVGNTMTLGRMPKTNRTNFVPTVKGFKNIDNVEEFPKIRKDVNGVHQNPPQVVNVSTWKNTTNGLQRSNSKVSSQALPVDRNILRLSNQSNVQVNNKFSNHDGSHEKEKQENISPFQVTLRRTGLKEKILLTDEVDSSRSPTSQRSDQQNSAKLELKLTTVSPAVNTPMDHTQKRQQQQLQSCPPPPPPPIIRSVVTKQNPGISRTQCITDPRDQLLSAIRGFNKGSLKRS